MPIAPFEREAAGSDLLKLCKPNGDHYRHKALSRLMVSRINLTYGATAPRWPHPDAVDLFPCIEVPLKSGWHADVVASKFLGAELPAYRGMYNEFSTEGMGTACCSTRRASVYDLPPKCLPVLSKVDISVWLCRSCGQTFNELRLHSSYTMVTATARNIEDFNRHNVVYFTTQCTASPFD